MPVQVGLRIDVDTFRGTRHGVPALVELLHKHGVSASFFMSVGPDNMGRHLWRLLKPQFLLKMLRSKAASLYGYDILLRGTAWPGPIIGNHLADIIRLPHEAGHEVGLHAWDHYSWQAHIDRFSSAKLDAHLKRGVEKLSDIIGQPPSCSAAAGWRCNEQALLLKEQFHFAYNSDCRGTSLFHPIVGGKKLTVQIPVTLPTYDEIIGSGGVTNDNFNSLILQQCKAGQLNVYTIHAEVEGMALLAQFEALLLRAKDHNIAFCPLRHLLDSATVADGIMQKKPLPGREGWLAFQGQAA